MVGCHRPDHTSALSVYIEKRVCSVQEAAPSETTEVLKQTAQTRRSRSPSGSSYSRLMMFGSRCRDRVLPVSFAYTPRSHGRGAARSPLQVSCIGRNPSGSMPDNTALCFIWTRYSNTVGDGGRRFTYIHIYYSLSGRTNQDIVSVPGNPTSSFLCLQTKRHQLGNYWGTVGFKPTPVLPLEPESMLIMIAEKVVWVSEHITYRQKF